MATYPNTIYINGQQRIKQVAPDGTVTYVTLQQAQQAAQTPKPTSTTDKILGAINTLSGNIAWRDWVTKATQPQSVAGTYVVNPSVKSVQDAYTAANQAAAAQQKQQQTVSTGQKTANQYQAWLASHGGQPPSGSDINPATGKAWAVNPASGAWDDNYFNNTVMSAFRQAGGTAGMAQVASQAWNIPSMSQLTESAFSELAPYYERILKETNYDLNLAAARMEEDYQKGLRRGRETEKTTATDLLTQAMPEEMSTLLGNLSQRGMLDTALGRGENPSYTTATGEVITAPMPTTRQFGGLAAKRIDLLTQGQKARQEAIQRALKQGEEDLGTERARTLSDVEEKRKRETERLREERTTRAGELAAQRYSSGLSEAALKQQLAMQG